MKTLRSTGLLLIIFLFITTAVSAQRRRPTAPKTPSPAPPLQPAPTFDNVLAADSYKIYGEIRGVGQLLRSPAFIDVFDPIMKVAAPPKEFKTLMKWLNSQSDELMTSRMMVAAWPSRPKLPAVFFAIEFASTEEAQKFEPRLKAFLPKFLPTPTPESSPAAVEAGVVKRNPARNPQDANPDAKPKETLPQYVVKQSGALVFISDVAFTFKNLRPTGSKLLTEDPNFRRVHDRFATESVLVYVDTVAMEREQQERYKQIYEEEQKRIEAEAANPSRTEADEAEAEMLPDAQIQSPPPPVSPVTDPDVVPQVQTETGQTVVRIADDSSGSPAPGPDVAGQAFGSIASLLFGGRTIWPEAVGVAVAFEPDSYSLRLLLVNEPGVRGNAIPFVPQLVSGPQLTPESPSVFPADTEFFVTLSLDYLQIYEGILKAVANETMPAGMRAPVRGAPPESPFAAYEKTFGIKIKDDLIPLLGNEIALSLPVKTLDVGPSQPVAEPSPEEPGEPDSTRKTSPPQEPNPVIAISVKDREGVRVLIPRLIESFGLKGASLLAQTEKRGDTEIVSYADAFSYAFIGNFLLVSPDPKAIRHVVDSYLNHETLAGESHFRNYTRWQPRQVLGQLYVSPALMESYTAFARNMDSSITDQLGDLLSRLSPTSEPVTYALSNEGLGPLHELRVPKNLALVMVAAIFGAGSLPPTPATNESVAKGLLRTIVSAEATYQATTGDGNYGTIEQLVENGLITKDMFEKNGYRIELTAMGSRFEATAVPLEYGKTGKLSFFVDESAVIRGGDKGGGPATVADNPVQ